MEPKIKGTVIWFNPNPGYGFIKYDGQNDNPDMFVHFSDINMDGFKTLKKGQQVLFSIGKNNKDEDKAVDVDIIDEK